MLMSSYGYSIEYIRKMTRAQIFLFVEKIADRENENNIFQAKLHGAYKEKGLKTDNAIPIEDILDGKNNSTLTM